MIIEGRNTGRCSKPWGTPVIVGTALLWCAIAAQTTAGSQERPGATPLLATDDSARSMFVLPMLDGPPQGLAQFRGRVVLVHFFATWCEPCRAEMASLRELQSQLEGRPLAIVPISVAEATGAVRRFFASDPVPFSILLDHDRSVARAWNIETLPSTVVLDARLKPRFMAEGDVDWTRLDVLNILMALLIEPPE